MLGLIVSLIGILGGVVAIITWLAGADIPAGWTTLVVMVAVLSGMQLMTLGLVGLYVGVVFDEAKKRPQILVAEVLGGRGGAATTGAPGVPGESARRQGSRGRAEGTRKRSA